MKVKKKITGQTVQGNSISVSLAILSAFLLCGIVAGAVTASYIGGDSGETLTEYMSRYVTAFGQGENPLTLLPATIWSTYKYPLCAFLFGFTVLGVLLIPGTVVLRGFFLAFSVGSMVKLFGMPGLWLAFSIFGIQTFIGLPCLLIISAQGFVAARSFARMMSGGKRVMIGSVFPRGYFVLFSVCMIALLVVVLLELFVTPKLVAFVALRMLQ